MGPDTPNKKRRLTNSKLSQSSPNAGGAVRPRWIAKPGSERLRLRESLDRAPDVATYERSPMRRPKR